MVVDYLFRVVHVAVTDLDGVSAENFSELVTFGKVLVYWGEEFVSDVGVLLKRRAVPEDVIALSHNIYIALLLCIEHCFTKVKILDLIYIYIYIISSVMHAF